MISLAAFLAAATACSADGIPEGATRLLEHVIIDHTLSSEQRAAPFAAILVPAGWSADGGVNWIEGDPCDVRWKLSWVARAPDGESEIGFVPAEAWTHSANPPQFSNCPSRDYGDAATHLGKLVERAGGKLGQSRPRGDIAAEFEAVVAEWRRNGGDAQVTAVETAFAAPPKDQCGAARYGLAVGVVAVMRMPSTTPQLEDRASAEPAMIYTGDAPIDPRLMEAVRSSVIVYPGWNETVRRMTQTWNDPYRKRSLLPVDWSKPERPAGEKRSFCGKEADAAGAANVWRAADGAYFFFPPAESPEMLAPPPADSLAAACAPG